MTQQSVVATNQPGGTGWLVGSDLLIADPTATTTIIELARDCLLLAQEPAGRPAAGASQDDADQVGVLTQIGWVMMSTQADSYHPGQGDVFTPWTLAQTSLAEQLTPEQLERVNRWLAVLASAGPPVAQRWQRATSSMPGQARCLVAVVAVTDDTAQLVIEENRLSYGPGTHPHPTPGFPWGQWPTAGAELADTTTALALDSTLVQPLLTALAPKVAPVLPTEVLEITP